MKLFSTKNFLLVGVFLCIVFVVGLIVYGATNGGWFHTDSNQIDNADTQDNTFQDPYESMFIPRSGVLTREDFSYDEKFYIHMCLMGGGESCHIIKDPANRETYGDAIAEQCEIMQGMPDCDEYFGTVSEAQDLGPEFDLSARSDFQPIGSTQFVQLNDGDSYEMNIENRTRQVAGQQLRAMSYNGSIPGPMLQVPQGSTIQLGVTNLLDDIDATVHHHGLRGKDTEDGVPVSMGGFDIPASYGDRLEYELLFPDPGVYWYHPHLREDVQQELGLYGNYLVMPSDPTYRNPVDDEQLIMLDDIQLTDEGIAPFYKDTVNQTIMGRYGTHFLVNGQEDYTLTLQQGAVTRLYVTNSANVRAFNLAVPGIEMKLVGSDLGAFERETFIDSLLISPAERYIVELLPTQAGTFSLDYVTPDQTRSIATIQVEQSDQQTQAAGSFSTLREHAIVQADIDQYRQYFTKPVDKTLRFDMTMHDKTSDEISLQMPHIHAGTTIEQGSLTYDLGMIEREDEMYEMNILSNRDNTTRQLIDEQTGQVNTDMHDRVFNQGDLIKVRLINDDSGMHPMYHPIHFHGQRFLVLNKNGQENTNLVRKDTVLTLPGEYTDILIDMANPGKRMAHCHISEHNESGMMLHFEVVASDS